jgi:hypothetical protein
MNAQVYLSVTSRLAYYEAMKMATQTRQEKVRPMKPPRKPLFRLPWRRGAILLPTEGLHA